MKLYSKRTQAEAKVWVNKSGYKRLRITDGEQPRPLMIVDMTTIHCDVVLAVLRDYASDWVTKDGHEPKVCELGEAFSVERETECSLNVAYADALGDGSRVPGEAYFCF